MKKLIAGLVVIVLVAWTGATWYSSNQTEASYDQMLADSNQKISEAIPFLKVEKQSYTKGFLKSTAKSVLTLDTELLGEDKGEIKLVSNETLYHGPTMITPDGLKTGVSYITSTLDQEAFSPEVKDVIKQIFAGKEPVVGGVLIGFDGNLETHLEMAPARIVSSELAKIIPQNANVSDDNLEMTFDGLTMDFTSDAEVTKLQGEVNIGAIEMDFSDQAKQLAMFIAPSIMKIDGKELYKNTLLLGTTEMKIPKLSIKDNQDVDVLLEGLVLNSNANEQNGKLSMRGGVDIDKLALQGTPSPIPESKVNFGLTVNGIERADVIKLIDLGQEMQQSQFALLQTDLDEKAVQKMMLKMAEYYTALGNMVKQNAEINQKLKISNATGESDLDLDLGYIDSKPLYDLKTIRDLIMALKGHLNISIDKGMLAGTELEQAIGMPVAMGFAVDQGEKYASEVNLAAGELLVNGEPMPILEMLGPMADELLPIEMIKQAMMDASAP